MAKLRDIVNYPNYTAAVSGASKGTIFVFIATFVYLAFFSGISPGLIGGASFFFVGIFVVSLLISMPLFLLRAKVPRFGALISLADIALTIFLTRAVYLWLFAAVSVAQNPFDKAIENYFAELDHWVDKGAPTEEIETIVVSRCGRILLAYSPLLTQIRLVTIGRDDYDFWVSMCVKMTMHRVWPQPEFEGSHKASLIKHTCESHEMWRRLCDRAEFGH